jgi:hypothetical protein
MKTIKLRTTDYSGGFLSRQPRADAPAGFDEARMEGTYVINNVPDDVTEQVVISKANKTAFVGTFEADYDQLGDGVIVHARCQD